MLKSSKYQFLTKKWFLRKNLKVLYQFYFILFYKINDLRVEDIFSHPLQYGPVCDFP